MTARRDPKTGKFVKPVELPHDPFRQGRTVNQRTYDESLAALAALEDALAQAKSLLDNIVGGKHG